MSEPLSIRVRLFGPFRDFSTESEAVLPIRGTPCGLEEIREALAGHLTRSRLAGGSPGPDPAQLARLIAQSALADEKRVLKAEDLVAAGTRLAILPPVCGG